MRKGVSPVLASVLVVLVVITMSAAFYTFSGETATQTTEAAEEQQQEFTEEITVDFRIEGVSDNKAFLRNSGSQNITEDSITAFLDDQRINHTLLDEIAPDTVGPLYLNDTVVKGLGKMTLKVTVGSASDSVPVEQEPVDGLIGHYTMDEGEGIHVNDSSGSSNNGIWNAPGPAYERRYVVSDRDAGFDLEVVSYEDGNTITAGTCSSTVDTGEINAFSSTCYSQGSVVEGTAPFSAHFQNDGSDGPVPESFAGKAFTDFDCRGTETFSFVSPFSDAHVTVSNSSHTLIDVNIPKGDFHTEQVDFLQGNVLVVDSDAPIVAHTYNNGHRDERMLHPVSDNLYGAVEKISVAKDNTHVTVYDSDGNKEEDIVLDRFDKVNVGIGSQVGSETKRIVANRSALGASRCADSDSVESDIAVSENKLSTKYHFPEPVGSDTTYYVIITTRGPGSCTVTDPDGNVIADRSVTQDLPHPGFIPIDNVDIPAGSKLSCDMPVAVQWEPQHHEGEANLYGVDEWPAGEFGTALEFHGREDFTDIGMDSDPFTEEITVSGWARLDDFGPGTHFRMASRWGLTSQWVLRVDEDGEPAFFIQDESGAGHAAVGSTGDIALDQWYHFAGIYNGSEAALYVDGNKVDETTTGGGLQDSTDDIRIGADLVPQHFWNGRIDDVRIYNRRLAPDELGREPDELYEINSA